MNCYTLDGNTIPDFFEFLRAHDIGQGADGAIDPEYLALINLKPGKSCVLPLGVVSRKPYDGDLEADMARQLTLAHKDKLTEADRAELRILTPKIHTYLNGSDA